MEEDIKKLLKHKNDYDVWNGSKISRPYKMTDEDFKLIENILNELERLQKENICIECDEEKALYCKCCYNEMLYRYG